MFLQRKLFPLLDEELGPLTAGERRLVSVLELIEIERFVRAPLRGVVGNPERDRRPVARAFVAKAVLNMPTTRALLDRVKSSPSLRRLCGWERRSEVPDESAFSRAFAQFAAGELPRHLHEALAKRHGEEKLVGHISRDSTAIEAREKALPKPKKRKQMEKPRKRGRPKTGEAFAVKEPTRLARQAPGTMTLEEMVKELPVVCDWGCKKNSQGKVQAWKGYKLHVDWADGGIPISARVTSASLHDSQVAIPLAELTARRVRSLYDLMDAAYDAAPIKAHSVSLGHVAIIDANARRGGAPEMEPAQAQRYKERSTAERGNARLKDEFGGRFVRVRGPVKVSAHLFFGLLALTADALLKLVP